MGRRGSPPYEATAKALGLRQDAVRWRWIGRHNAHGGPDDGLMLDARDGTWYCSTCGQNGHMDALSERLSALGYDDADDATRSERLAKNIAMRDWPK